MNNDTYSVVDIVVYGIGAIAGANDAENGKPMEPANMDIRYVAGYKMGYVVNGVDDILGEESPPTFVCAETFICDGDRYTVGNYHDRT